MKTGEYIMKPVGDRGVLVIFGSSISEEINERVMMLEQQLLDDRFYGMIETLPAFCSLLVLYDPVLTEYDEVSRYINNLTGQMTKKINKRGKLVEIPVCYGGQYGEDLAYVAEHAGMTKEEVIRIHAGRDYRIYMIGFLPGFPYLGGLDERLYTPRLSKPRTSIPAGSVGIGGEQTGIYPVESPGGWQLIGQTPLKLFDTERESGGMYAAGDCIRFVPVSQEEFLNIKDRGR